MVSSYSITSSTYTRRGKIFILGTKKKKIINKDEKKIILDAYKRRIAKFIAEITVNEIL